MNRLRRARGIALVLAASLGVVAAPLAARDDLANLPDPTRPAVGAGAVAGEIYAPGALVLEATLVSPGRKSAVINGQSVRVGARIGDAQVVDIKPYEVIVKSGGRETSLRLTPRLGQESKTR